MNILHITLLLCTLYAETNLKSIRISLVTFNAEEPTVKIHLSHITRMLYLTPLSHKPLYCIDLIHYVLQYNLIMTCPVI